jgi:hypothetical protein
MKFTFNYAPKKSNWGLNICVPVEGLGSKEEMEMTLVGMKWAKVR